MKRIFLLFVVLIFIVLPVFAFSLSKEDLDKVLDTSVTIKTLDLSLQNNKPDTINADKFVLLNGTVSSIIFLNRKRNDYEVVLEVVSGEWIGLDEVKSYRVYVDFKGKDYYDLIPPRKPRHPRGYEILRNTGVILIARVLQPVVPPGAQSENEKVWFLKGVYIRKIY